jgi:hypothetical protein
MYEMASSLIFLIAFVSGLLVLISIFVAVVLRATRDKPQWPRDLEMRP